MVWMRLPQMIHIRPRDISIRSISFSHSKLGNWRRKGEQLSASAFNLGTYIYKKNCFLFERLWKRVTKGCWPSFCDNDEQLTHTWVELSARGTPSSRPNKCWKGGKKKGTDHLLGLRKGIPSHRLMEGEGWAQQRRMGEGIGSEMQLEK